jgi:hypothetical protein
MQASGGPAVTPILAQAGRAGYNGHMASLGVYKTRQGMIFRIADTVEAGPKVEVLKEGIWVPGRIAMFGLRLDADTTKLSAAAVDKLPS